jgi:hypothetical protein
MERGRIYGSFTAHYGETVEVRGSSAVAPQCWLEINSAKDKNDYMAGERVEANALLTLPQARSLRVALDAFIESAQLDES